MLRGNVRLFLRRLTDCPGTVKYTMKNSIVIAVRCSRENIDATKQFWLLQISDGVWSVVWSMIHIRNFRWDSKVLVSSDPACARANALDSSSSLQYLLWFVTKNYTWFVTLNCQKALETKPEAQGWTLVTIPAKSLSYFQ